MKFAPTCAFGTVVACMLAQSGGVDGASSALRATRKDEERKLDGHGHHDPYHDPYHHPDRYYYPPPPPKQTPNPTERPTPRPTPLPTDRPTPHPTPTPSSRPTPRPTPNPTEMPTPRPTGRQPTERPTPEPTLHPTGQPSPEPSPEPTLHPSPEPSPEPTRHPSAGPSPEPSEEPSENPTFSEEPSENPTFSEEPSENPTFSEEPSENPTESFEPTITCADTGTVADVICCIPILTTLCSTIEQTGQDVILDDDVTTTFTVFAPTNDAFDDFTTFLNSSNVTISITGLINYHIVGNETLLADELSCAANATSIAMNVGGDTETLCTDQSPTGQTGTCQNRYPVGGLRPNFVRTDLEATNGIIHIVDQILLPSPNQSVDGCAIWGPIVDPPTEAPVAVNNTTVVPVGQVGPFD